MVSYIESLWNSKSRRTPGYFPPTSIPGSCCLSTKIAWVFLLRFNKNTNLLGPFSSTVSWLLHLKRDHMQCRVFSWPARCEGYILLSIEMSISPYEMFKLTRPWRLRSACWDAIVVINRAIGGEGMMAWSQVDIASCPVTQLVQWPCLATLIDRKMTESPTQIRALIVCLGKK